MISRPPSAARCGFTGRSQLVGMMNFRESKEVHMNRRFGFPLIWGLATAAIATIVGLIAYHAGQTAQIVTTTGGDGRVLYPGFYGGLGSLSPAPLPARPRRRLLRPSLRIRQLPEPERLVSPPPVGKGRVGTGR